MGYFNFFYKLAYLINFIKRNFKFLFVAVILPILLLFVINSYSKASNNIVPLAIPDTDNQFQVVIDMILARVPYSANDFNTNDKYSYFVFDDKIDNLYHCVALYVNNNPTQAGYPVFANVSSTDMDIGSRVLGSRNIEFYYFTLDMDNNLAPSEVVQKTMTSSTGWTKWNDFFGINTAEKDVFNFVNLMVASPAIVNNWHNSNFWSAFSNRLVVEEPSPLYLYDEWYNQSHYVIRANDWYVTHAKLFTGDGSSSQWFNLNVYKSGTEQGYSVLLNSSSSYFGLSDDALYWEYSIPVDTLKFALSSTGDYNITITNPSLGLNALLSSFHYDADTDVITGINPDNPDNPSSPDYSGQLGGIQDSLGDMNNFFQDGSYNQGTITDNMPSSDVDDITSAPLDNFFTALKDAFTSDNYIDIVIDLPFVDGSITIPADFLYDKVPASIVSLIQLVYWFMISRYIFLDVTHYIDKMKSGDIISTSETDIKADML